MSQLAGQTQLNWLAYTSSLKTILTSGLDGTQLICITCGSTALVEPAILVFERAKTVHALDRAATVITKV
jgi:hypothetical protein